MTENYLKELPIDSLFDLMAQRTKELLGLKSEEDEIALKIKKKEVELLQRVIVAKRAEFPPG